MTRTVTAPEAELLSIRTVNQYRRRDVVGYLGVRLYLSSRCTRRDRWARDVASSLARVRREAPYHRSLHFKETSESGRRIYRGICVPPPNQALAEAAILAECAEHRDALQTSGAFSYRLALGADTRGMFLPYFEGFRRRHDQIAAACRQHEQGLVVYTDIRRFYPSLSADLVLRAWREACARGQISEWALRLGEHLLESGARACEPDESGLLTGPMLCHLAADVSLRAIDEEMAQALHGAYFRYVDDIVLVGDPRTVRDAEARLMAALGHLGLEPKAGKRIEVGAREWLDSVDDFSGDDGPVSWKALVGGLRMLLLRRPALLPDIRQAFFDAGFRIDPLDYRDVATEREYLDWALSLLNTPWLRRVTKHLGIVDVLGLAVVLRRRYEQELWHALAGVEGLEGYARKRRIYKLRRLAGRLVYLADPLHLPQIADRLRTVREMDLHAAVFRAMAEADVSELVEFGVNAAHAAAQPLRAMRRRVRCRRASWPAAAVQARAVLMGHDLLLDESGSANVPPDAMTAFMVWGANQDAFGERDSYFHELATIHGLRRPRRHVELLTTAFHPDEEMAFEMEDLGLDSS